MTRRFFCLGMAFIVSMMMWVGIIGLVWHSMPAKKSNFAQPVALQQ
jgi:hypothetical protein